VPSGIGKIKPLSVFELADALALEIGVSPPSELKANPAVKLMIIKVIRFISKFSSH
jgi:hypothetical protein